VQLALLIDGQGVDREITPGQVVLERHRFVGLKDKPLIAPTGFALGSGQCVFGMVDGVQKHWKVFAHWHKTSGQQMLRSATHHQVVPVCTGLTQQGVSNRSADTEESRTAGQLRHVRVGSIRGQRLKRRRERIKHHLSWPIDQPAGA